MSDEQPFDPFRLLIEHADHLNQIDSPGESPRVFYEFLSGGLVWTDETTKATPIEVIWDLRFLVAYRTGLILAKPRDEFKLLWDHSQSLFPRWVGFRPERSQPTPELLDIYRRGRISLEKCLRDMERQITQDPTSPDKEA